VIIVQPLEFAVGPLTVTGFGLTMALAFMVGAWIMERETRRLRFSADFVGDMILGAVVGGIVGAKLWYVALYGIETLWSRSGLVFYGGFLGGVIGVILMGWVKRVPIRWTMHLAAPALAAAYAIGRVGCFVVGDDYGRPTDLPWAVAFPNGAPPSLAGIMTRQFGTVFPAGTDPATLVAVHPTQLYEVAIMLVAFAVLWRWRTATKGTGWLFGAYLVFAGAERFAVEILRAKDDRFLGPLTLAQATGILSIVIGAALWSRLAPAAAIEPEAYLQRGKGRV
jgi:phosphatidylglycerol:prolipoprotein diacylglycerol transferase